jgi:hypothetical protein
MLCNTRINLNNPLEMLATSKQNKKMWGIKRDATQLRMQSGPSMFPKCVNVC